MKKLITLTLTALTFGSLAHADLMKDFDSLGGNDVLMEKSKAIHPDEKISIVQDRIVQTRHRQEIAPEFSGVMGGDAYIATQNIGLNYQYHISPHWSIGAKYNYAFNSLRAEAQASIDEAQRENRRAPDFNYVTQTYMAVGNWYPIYGKMNLLDMGVSHFDVYTLAGAGQVMLSRGNSFTYTVGGGIALYLSQHLNTRLEMRYQNYNSQKYTGNQSMDLTVASMQIGYLL
jgi:outer membrane immunogenic protein